MENLMDDACVLPASRDCILWGTGQMPVISYYDLDFIPQISIGFYYVPVYLNRACRC